ncbi:TetR/AcrR family transcriptional regulator [Zavarzinia compransoris]|uniref:TetR/AcrR family transcriptional regulator n=1 Tax=Zavarzinia compransoris TaxID=1264899 RepID=UPI0010EB48A3|nr:TetR/AcrR family transcriptional regulator [Zavarzinia compransoris]TDP49299.1 TetR family transcriptional regulator [Zavarzinia compransoris]
MTNALEPPKSPAKPRRPEETRAALLDAAAREFEETGFEQTNTNRIARRAGYAPQTFYRHFPDKLAIFLAVYERWVGAEAAAFAATDRAIDAADVLIRHHRGSLMFRRTLRALTLTDPRVRAARAASRLAQVERLRQRFPQLAQTGGTELAFSLLTIERLADAHVEGELRDMGLAEADSRQELARRLAQAFAIPH